MVIHVPPLKARGNDILLLARHFLRRFGSERGRTNFSLSPETEQRLLSYHWPGNVRELRNLLERAVLLAPSDTITPDLIVLDTPTLGPPDNGNASLSAAEKRHIFSVLARAGGNKSRAAEVLGISRSTLKEKLKEYGGEMIL